MQNPISSMADLYREMKRLKLTTSMEDFSIRWLGQKNPNYFHSKWTDAEVGLPSFVSLTNALRNTSHHDLAAAAQELMSKKIEAIKL